MKYRLLIHLYKQFVFGIKDYLIVVTLLFLLIFFEVSIPGISTSLELELFVGLLIAFLIFYVQHNSDFEKKKKELRSFYNEVILTSIKHSFERSTNTLNLSSYLNKAFFFDNSYINHLYGAISFFEKDLYELCKYDSSLELAKKLLSFKDSVETAYIKGESMDVLLESIYYHHDRNMVSSSLSVTYRSESITRAILYVKAKYFAEYDAKLLYLYFDHLSEGFINDTYSKRSLVDDQAKDLYLQYTMKEEELINIRKELIRDSLFIKDSLL